VPTKPTWGDVVPPSYLKEDSIELIMVASTQESLPLNTKKKKKDAKGMDKQHDDFIE
jgi:hypothetical protein